MVLEATDWPQPGITLAQILNRPETMALVPEESLPPALEVEVQRLLEVVWVGDDPRKPANVIIYVCKAVGGELRAASDVSEVAWFSLTDLPEDMGFGNRELIGRFLDR